MEIPRSAARELTSVAGSPDCAGYGRHTTSASTTREIQDVKQFWQNSRALWLGLALLTTTAVDASAQTTPAQDVAQNLDTSDEALVKQLPGFSNDYADVNGIRLHFVQGGAGQPLFLLGGWPQTWWEFHKIMPDLAKHFRVIAVDIRGQGTSSRPATGYDKKTMAGDIHALARSLGYQRVYIAGHDIGAMVAYSYAANYPDDTLRIALLDVPHPFEGFQQISILPPPHAYEPSSRDFRPHPWWFAMNQVPDLPEQLLQGRMSILQNWVFDYLMKVKSSISPFDRSVFIAAYSSPDAIIADDGWYSDIWPRHRGSQDISQTQDSRAWYRRHQLSSGGDVRRWVPEERPRETTEALVRFFQ
jgi:pimeloyl-ACP methyl ester carboxylesterase